MIDRVCASERESGLRYSRLIFLLLLVALADRATANDDLFRDQVVPIFQTHCVRCHNRSESKGDFSLENARSFFEGGYVEPGDASASMLVELIAPGDGNKAEMPKTGPALSEQQVNSIKRWIDGGAKWPDDISLKFDPDAKPEPNYNWWSLQPIQRPDVPQSNEESAVKWIRTPIDAFVWRKLAENGLTYSAEGDKRTLIRRVSYDLTGLPPTFTDIVDFQNDDSPDAYENLVDRLLASPRYGEHWARHWLDVVKYADTCGYDKDKLRPNAWPYRDYVIRSLNDDKPYKQFVQEQIAGDVLFPGEPDGILGLGFIAAGPWDFIGHVEVPESKIDGKVARNLDRDDMVSNTFNTFCSVTIQCARCHNHKFDPFTQQHYYGLQAVFAAVDRADRVYDEDPLVVARRNQLKQEIDGFQFQLDEIVKQVAVAGGEDLKQLERQIEESKQLNKQPEFGYHSQVAARADAEKWVELSFAESTPFQRIVLRPCHDEFNGIGAGFGFPVRFRVEIDGVTVFDKTDVDFPNPRLSPVTIPVSVTGSKIRIVATKLAERSNDFHLALAEIQVFNNQDANLAGGASVTALDTIEAPIRWRKSNLIDGIWFESNGSNLASLEQQRSEWVERLVGQQTVARQADLQRQLAAARMELGKLPMGKLVYAAATEFPPEGNFKPTLGTPRDVRFLARGDVTNPGEEVEPGLLPFSHEDSADFVVPTGSNESGRRAALARWLTSDSNPMTWRSIVNRVWHYHFGRGIVNTPNDFGRMGGERSHPELLDWLASEFRDGSESARPGSLKDLHRLIVTSSVYRQSSNHSGVCFQKDSSNRLLWKMNRRRLSAEEIRDSILLASGTLDLEMGGPGYYLFALEKTEHSPHYEYHKFDHLDPGSYRRSIYRFVVRSQPDPFMTTLDCADSSQSTPARNETQTPLQSLTMLNSDFNLVMARKFAQRIGLDDELPQAKLNLAMQLLVGRRPDESEQRLMLRYVDDYGWENLARIMFNLSEFVFVD